MLRRLSMVVWLAGLLSCAHPSSAPRSQLASAATPSAPQEGATPCPPFPEAPPDSLPAAVAREIYAPENLVYGSEFMSGVYPRNVIWVFFHRGATRAEREVAIRSICGEVIGGWRIGTNDGIYVIQIRDDGTAAPLFRAMARLEEFPQVMSATPDIKFQFGVPSRVR